MNKAAVWSILAGSLLLAQSPRFDVASVKPCKAMPVSSGARSGGGIGHATVSPGRIELQCFTVSELIKFAYVVNGEPLLNDVPRPLDPQKVRRGPGWAYSELYEITATAQGAPTRRSLAGSMLQALLEDRFHLKIHRETEEGPAYALMVAKGGPKFSPTPEGGCISAFDPATHDGFFRAGEKLPCGLVQNTGSGSAPKIDGAGIGLDRIATELSGSLDRPVVDRTGLTGVYNIHLEFATAETMRLPTASAAGSAQTPADPAGAPSVFQALAALGLRLESVKAQHGYIVIDHVERPDEN